MAVGIGWNFYGFSIEKQPKILPPENSSTMLEVIHKNF